MYLSTHVTTKPRFSRSANVERDSGVRAIDGYVPTGRALDVVKRVTRGWLDPTAGRTLSITGPHGGGKSSLAVFLDALHSPRRGRLFHAAIDSLATVDAEAAELLLEAAKSVDSGGRGFVRALATASQEPVSATIARALHAGAIETFGVRQGLVPESFRSATHVPSARKIIDTLGAMCADRPVLLLVDEFGKNLEHFAATGRDGDPYLLQELAEATQGERAWPLVIVTMQHLAFDDYVQEASVSRRRGVGEGAGALPGSSVRGDPSPVPEAHRSSRRSVL